MQKGLQGESRRVNRRNTTPNYTLFRKVILPARLQCSTGRRKKSHNPFSSAHHLDAAMPTTPPHTLAPALPVVSESSCPPWQPYDEIHRVRRSEAGGHQIPLFFEDEGLVWVVCHCMRFPREAKQARMVRCTGCPSFSLVLRSAHLVRRCGGKPQQGELPHHFNFYAPSKKK